MPKSLCCQLHIYIFMNKRGRWAWAAIHAHDWPYPPLLASATSVALSARTWSLGRTESSSLPDTREWRMEGHGHCGPITRAYGHRSRRSFVSERLVGMRVGMEDRQRGSTIEGSMTKRVFREPTSEIATSEGKSKVRQTRLYWRPVGGAF